MRCYLTGGERVRDCMVRTAAPPPVPPPSSLGLGPALSEQGLGLPLALDEDAMVGWVHVTPPPATQPSTMPTATTHSSSSTSSSTTSTSTSSLAHVLTATGTLVDFLIAYSTHKHAQVTRLARGLRHIYKKLITLSYAAMTPSCNILQQPYNLLLISPTLDILVLY